ncbi:MAG: Gfo/Idh/MocA family oxidoreductase [Chloroflexota bacterium]
MPDKIVRVALIGGGGWGKEHARVFSGRTDVDFCAIVGHDAAKTQERAARLKVRGYLDIGEMLEKEQPDLVSLALPNLTRFPPTLQVIQAGFPLIVEKPLAFDLDEAEQLLQAAASRNLFFAIVFNHRYGRPVQMAHQAIADGRLGDITFSLWRFGGEWIPDHPYMTLIESFCHGFDILEYLCGPIASVMCEMTDKTGHGFRSVTVGLKFSNGAVGNLIGGYDSSFTYKQTQFLEVNGTRGRILVEDTVQKFSFQAVGEETRTVWEAGYFNDYSRSFHATLDTYMDVTLESFKRGEPPPVHARCGQRALQLAKAAIRSHELGQRIVLPLP